jgi:hypothetical protein
MRVLCTLGVLLACCSPESPRLGDDQVDTPSSDAAGSVDVDSAVEGAPPMWSERGLSEYRAIVHLHSAFSHDACDEEGLDETGKPNQNCIDRMKAALCKERIDVAFMTDHPSFMREQNYSELLYADADAGDALVLGQAGAPRGAIFPCSDSEHQVFLVPGFEGTHTMPIGLHEHLPKELYSVSFTVDTPEESLFTLTEAVREAGGLVTIAHSEQTDIDAATIAGHDVSAMEIYNFHANFNEVLGDNLAAMIMELDPFLGPKGDEIPGDLAALLMLGNYPEAALEKWHAVQRSRRITAFAGSDVHENVLIPALCADLDCSELAEESPHLAEFLKTGGPLKLQDGQRIDAYERVFRWVNNRVRIRADGDPTTEVQAGLEEGRNVVVFGLLGSSDSMDFVGEVGPDASFREIGDTAPVGSRLWIRTPEVPEGAKLKATVFRIGPEELEPVFTTDKPNTWSDFQATKPGPHYLEVYMTPLHLKESLRGSAPLAEKSYRWIVTNPVFIE